MSASFLVSSFHLFFYFLLSWAVLGTRQDLQVRCHQLLKQVHQPCSAYEPPMSTLARAFANESGQKDSGLMQAPLLRGVLLCSRVSSLPCMSMHMYVGICMPGHMCQGTTCRSQVSLSLIWVLGTQP